MNDNIDRNILQMVHACEQFASHAREIAGHLNRIAQQNTEIISLLRLVAGVQPLSDEQRRWLEAARKEGLTPS